jgi:hypothetical protein
VFSSATSHKFDSIVVFILQKCHEKHRKTFQEKRKLLEGNFRKFYKERKFCKSVVETPTELSRFAPKQTPRVNQIFKLKNYLKS